MPGPTKHYEYQGRFYTLRELSVLANTPVQTIASRLDRYGWTVEEAISTQASTTSNQRSPWRGQVNFARSRRTIQSDNRKAGE
jgi:hypothetical protein